MNNGKSLPAPHHVFFPVRKNRDLYGVVWKIFSRSAIICSMPRCVWYTMTKFSLFVELRQALRIIQHDARWTQPCYDDRVTMGRAGCERGKPGSGYPPTILKVDAEATTLTDWMKKQSRIVNNSFFPPLQLKWNCARAAFLFIMKPSAVTFS